MKNGNDNDGAKIDDLKSLEAKQRTLLDDSNKVQLPFLVM